VTTLCGVELFESGHVPWRGMLGQSTPPLIELLAAMAG
jgi:hypothetical protein